MSLLADVFTGGLDRAPKLFGDLTGANQAASAAQSAADAQIQSADKANALQKYMFDTTSANFAPYLSAGGGALNQIMALNGLNPDGSRSSTPIDYSAITDSPGYKFGLDQGLQGVQRQLAAGGMSDSGAALKEMNNYAHDYAGQQFSDFYNRLANIAAGGQSAAGMKGQFGANYATNAGNNLMGQGNAQASAYIAKGNVAANNFNNLMKLGGTAAGFMGGFPGMGGGMTPAATPTSYSTAYGG